MNKLIKKTICGASIVTLCSMYALPIFAVGENKTLYSKMNSNGEIYQTISDGDKVENNLPIDTSINYFLNDEEISINDLKGKSGRVKIKINYVNKDERVVSIDGRQVKLYTPYIVACGMILDNNKFDNITINSGKTLENGEHTVLIGIAMPGMQSSLDLSKDTIEIPEEVVIEMDTKEFELGNIYMYVEKNVFEDTSFDFLDEFESMYKDIQSLKDASKQLAYGSKTLKEGVSTYTEKIGEFNNGLNSYTDGVNQVNLNYDKIDSGISTININTKKIAKGNSELSNGIKSLKSNLNQMIDAMSTIKNGTDAIDNGLGKMIESIGGSVNDIQDGIEASSQMTGSLKELGTATQTSIYKLNATKTELNNTIKQLKVSSESLNKTLNSISDEETKQEISSEIDLIDTQIKSLEQQMKQIDSELENLNSNVGNERGTYQKVLASANENTLKILQGLKTLQTSLRQLKGASSGVKGGIDKIVNSSPELKNGLNTLQSGANTLTNGTNELSFGTETLRNGSNELKNGIETLNSNSDNLKNAGNLLQDGANTILDGTVTLSDGISKFDNEGINKIYNLINGDVKNAQNRIEKLIEISKENKDKSDKNTYKYILKVDSIK